MSRELPWYPHITERKDQMVRPARDAFNAAIERQQPTDIEATFAPYKDALERFREYLSDQPGAPGWSSVGTTLADHENEEIILHELKDIDVELKEAEARYERHLKV